MRENAAFQIPAELFLNVTRQGTILLLRCASQEGFEVPGNDLVEKSLGRLAWAVL